MQAMNGIYHLKGTVKHYDWGGFFFLPSLLNLGNKEMQPFAEYWMGTHPLGQSSLSTKGGKEVGLEEKTGPLPFLFKVLDVKDMLSIQVHPSKGAAQLEFARENAQGIPIDAPGRNYKDDNHKPELMVALSDFWLLHGFKPEEDLTEILTNIEELNELLPVFKQTGYKGLYKRVMEMPQSSVNRILQPHIDKVVPLYNDNALHKDSEDFWAARAAISFSDRGNVDRGIFSIYFFNLLELKKREGIFQPAGVPHAYLEGQNVEIMASSDNVLRGGLTNKHIDVKELMKHIKCEAWHPRIITPRTSYEEKVYMTPAEEFKLSVFEIPAGKDFSFTPGSSEILLLTEGRITLSDGHTELGLAPGNPAALILPGNAVTLSGIERSTVFRAGRP